MSDWKACGTKISFYVDAYIMNTWGDGCTKWVKHFPYKHKDL